MKYLTPDEIAERRRAARADIAIPSRRHQASLPPGLPTKGFAAELERHCNIKLGRERVVPDAFEFDLERRRLTLYEVIATNPIGPEKAARLHLLKAVLGSLGWSMRLRIASPGSRFAAAVLRKDGVSPTRYQLRRAVEMLNRTHRVSCE